MHLKNLFLIVFCLITVLENTQGQKKIKWLTWDEALEKSKLEQKKILVDIYTKWCGWCKRMDKSTLRDEFIVEYVNENFYPVKFDAEYQEDIILDGVVYSYEKSGKKGYHALAKTLTKGRLSFPTFVVLDENFEILPPLRGFQDKERFEKVITFFATEMYKSTPWRRYERSYNRDTYALPAGNH